jgi:hypothetical protein
MLRSHPPHRVASTRGVVTGELNSTDEEDALVMIGRALGVSG